MLKSIKNIDWSNEEAWNVLTHFFGVLLSIAGGIYLISLSMDSAMPFGLTSVVIFVISLIVLYFASSLYHFHCLRFNEDSRKLKRIDHIAIYFLIAGTYTPFTLLVLKDSMGLWILGAIWFLAIAGTIFKLFYIDRYEWLSLILYIFMGWLVLIDIFSLIDLSSTPTLLLLMSGGISYSLGTIFYMNRNMRFNHVIWHVFVLGGSTFHFLSIATLF